MDLDLFLNEDEKRGCMTSVELRRLEDGAVVASAKAPHPATTPPVSEQDPEMWWQALSNAVSKLGDHRSDVVAMSIAGQQHGLVLLDHDNVARPRDSTKTVIKYAVIGPKEFYR